MKRKLKYLTFVGVVLIGFAAWHVGGPETAEPRRWKEIQLLNGSWCADSLITACVSPSGEVTIPRGEAAETLSAYFKIRRHIPGAEPLGVLGYETSRGMPVYTNQVTGDLSAREALDRMLDGTGLEASYFPRGISVRPRK